MTISWPPSPFVEDEAAALSREHGLSQALNTAKAEDQPADSRGSVDQYPVIIDVEHKSFGQQDSSTSEAEKDNTSSDGQSSDESHGPPTPTAHKSEQRFVLLDHEIGRDLPREQQRPVPRSKSTNHLKDDKTPRGRPVLAPIHTNIGNDLDEMVTGRRRPPSPYAYQAKPESSATQSSKRFPGESLLSPQAAPVSQSASTDYRRAASTGPRVLTEKTPSSTDSEQRPERTRHHSRRRSRRESGVRSERPNLERFGPSAFDKRSVSYVSTTASASMLSKGLHSEGSQNLAEVDALKKKRYSRESPYTSSAEETKLRSSSKHRSSTHHVKESPYTSSAEESTRRSRRTERDSGTEGRSSRRQSTHKGLRPRLDVSSQHYSYGGGTDPLADIQSSRRRQDAKHHSVFDGRTYLEPAPVQSPQALEAYFENAFKENNTKRSSHPLHVLGSPAASPFASPPRSPPRTPRGERRSKDYFDLVSPVIQSGTVRSRQPSSDDATWSALKPSIAITAGSAGLLATRPTPSLSRSSTTSIEPSSNNSSSKPSSIGQRSRRPSPVHEEDTRPVSRASSFTMSEEHPLPRISTFPLNDTKPISRPTSRAGSTLIEAPRLNEFKPLSRNSTAPLEPPRTITRAYSYSPAGDIESRPSTSYRTSSSHHVSPSSATAPFQAPAQRPVIYPSTQIQGTPSHIVAEQAPTNLPACPRSIPVAGHRDWYTIKQVPDIDICPTCMATLGSSRFRDIFVPALAKPANKEVRCAMSRLWLRIAYIQLVKQRRSPQEMIKVVNAIIHVPESTIPCPGKSVETRLWYHLIDPHDGSPVPNFEACSSCVRNVDTVFPQLVGTFKRTSSLCQEKGCDLNCHSKRFLGYIDQLDKAATKHDQEQLRKPDIRSLVEHTRRMARIPECSRDNMLSQKWYFMPELSEFTVCEECFEEVVWPVFDKQLAKNFHTKPRSLPAPRDGTHVSSGARSCQLYSERMRKVFLDAVRMNGFESLKQAAVKRHEVEVLLQEKHRLMLRDARAGIDRKADMAKNVEIWKSWE